METYHPNNLKLTKYLFYTGKGGVGKTSAACATAVILADQGKKVLLISTDPASNLQDVFETELDNKGVVIKEVANLIVVNLDPMQAAAQYRESVIAPYRGKLPDAILTSMEEQLSGSCTVEIAAFSEFSKFITDPIAQRDFDYIIFDTAPTGHTLRMLQLPSAWSDFISENTHGASCLGQLSGLESQKEVYRKAVATLADPKLTTLLLVTRPEVTPLIETQRASSELAEIGCRNQLLIINGMLTSFDDAISRRLFEKQQKALLEMPNDLKHIESYSIPLRAYNITGVEALRALLIMDDYVLRKEKLKSVDVKQLKDVVDDLYKSEKKVIFTMGKGGVGKTTIAATIALGLSIKGRNIHLSTTDPAAHLQLIMHETNRISMSHIDEKAELAKYTDEILAKARETMSADDVAYIEEDLRSPCTQEIAVFRAFAQIVQKAQNQIVVIDTAPTGHTLLLLDATQSYHREIERSQGEIPQSVRRLLPRLRNEAETEVMIVTLAEATPYYEALRLEEDLVRAGISIGWWIINASLLHTATSNQMLLAKASNEIEWINKIDEHTHGKFAIVKWNADDVKEEQLLELLA